ncbi:MAG: 4'-phosphopantetheinyl transferase superfamily protein [Leptospirales bacterium]
MNISAKKLAIGNDIVDLFDSDSLDVLQNSKFIERVFTANEIRHIQNSPQKEKTAWAMWAAKESTFKALARFNSDTLFSPIKFEVFLEREIVTYKNASYPVKNFETSEYVASVCLNSSKQMKYKQWISKFDTIQDMKELSAYRKKVNSYSEESRLCHCYALWLLENEIGLSDVTIVKTSASPRFAPVIHCENRPQPALTLSLSHHGRFCFVAVCNTEN